VESLLAHQKELEKQLRGIQQQKAVEQARELKAKAETFGSAQAVVQNLGQGDGEHLQAVADSLKGQFNGVVVLGSTNEGAVALVAAVPAGLTSKVQAGKIIQAIAPIVGGKGGGRPDNARGGGKDVVKLDDALGRARELIRSACAA
jgi:alanyl-tRNA synthetase